MRIRIIPKEWRAKIQHYLGQLPAVWAKRVFSRKHPIMVVTELYYGNLTYGTNRTGSEQLDFLLRRTSNESVDRYLNGKVRVYEFDHQCIPFAMRIESLESFMASP